MTDNTNLDAMASGGSPHLASSAALATDHGGGFEIPFAKRQREDNYDESAAKKGKLDMNSDPELLKDDLGASQADFNKGSCHQCKSRRAIGDLIFCTNIVDKKNKHCRKKYCEGCLKKFYKEDVSDPAARTNWSCPSCRKMCCCAACRRRRDPKEATAQVTPHQLPSDQAMMSSMSGQMMQSNFPPFESSGIFSSLMREPSGGTPISYMPNNMGAFQPQLPQDHPLFSQPNTTAGVPQSSSFAMLYAVAQMPHVRDQIKQILHRTDLTDEQKVESIAALLRRAVVGDENADGTAQQTTDPEATCDETANEFGNEEA